MSSEERNHFFGVRQHAKADVEKVFGPHGDANLAQRIFRENTGYYYSLRAQAVSDGLLAPNTMGPLERAIHDKEIRDAGPAYSDAELAAMVEFDRGTCERYFKQSGDGNSDNAASLRTADAAKYSRLKVAAKARGVLPKNRDEQAVPEAGSAERISIGQALAEKAGLSPDLKISQHQLNVLVQTVAQIETAKAQAAAASKDDAR
jgi:hypothetical protein